MKLSPGLHQAPFSLGKAAAQDLKPFNGKDSFMVLIVSVEMRAAVLSAWLGVHTDNDAEETADLWHAMHHVLQQDASILHHSAPAATDRAD
jgi:hypothetical protein